MATDRLSLATGRSVSIGGEVRPTLFPMLGVRVEDLAVANPDWVADGPLIEARGLRVGLDWSELLQGRLRIARFELEAPRIVLIRDESGRTSWNMGEAPTPAPATGVEAAGEGGAVLRRLGVDEAVITNGGLLFVDRSSGQTVTAEEIDARLVMPDSAGDAALDLRAELLGETVEAEARIAMAAAFLSGGVEEAEFVITWPDGEVRFDGVASLGGVSEGRISLDARDLALPMRLAGSAPSGLPAGFGRDRITLDGDLTTTAEGSLHLRGTTIGLDDNRLLADLDLMPGDARPMLRGNLSAASLAIESDDAGRDANDSAAAQAEAQTGWPRDQIDVNGLFAMDAELALSTERLRVGPLRLGLTGVQARLDDGRLVLDIPGAQAYGGAVAGEVVVNGRGGLSARADLALQAVELQPLLIDAADYDRLIGSGDLSVSLLGAGDSVDALMRSLDGEIAVALGQGAIDGLDIAGMIRNLDTSFRGPNARTVYESLDASFVITDGVARGDDLLLTASWGGVQGEGLVDIGAQRLDYLVVPGVLRRGEGAGQIAVPVRVSGPWSDPSFAPDLGALAEIELEANRDEIEARVGEALGIETGEELDIRDAVEDRLRQEAEDALRRLFE